MPRNGGVHNPKLQSETVQEVKLYGIVAKLLPERIAVIVRDRNRVLSMQVSIILIIIIIVYRSAHYRIVVRKEIIGKHFNRYINERRLKL